jgi:hypothetical protein
LPRKAHWWALVLVAHILLLLLLLHVKLLAELLFPALGLLTHHVALVEHARIFHEAWWHPAAALLLRLATLLVLHVVKHGHRWTSSRKVLVHHLRRRSSWLLHESK